jgi:hypothetical protein
VGKFIEPIGAQLFPIDLHPRGFAKDLQKPHQRIYVPCVPSNHERKVVSIQGGALHTCAQVCAILYSFFKSEKRACELFMAVC